jgi:hypothetical protein
MILAVTLFVASTAATAGAVYLFFGHYWHRVLTEKDDND